MKQKKFLTEADRKKAISEKEKAILENFAKSFNKIKRIDENEVSEAKALPSDWKNPISHEEFVKIAKEKGYKTKEEAAEALGLRYNGEKWVDKRNEPYRKAK